MRTWLDTIHLQRKWDEITGLRDGLEMKRQLWCIEPHMKEIKFQGAISRLRETRTPVVTWLFPMSGPCLASPKSESFGLNSSSSNTLAVLKSRKITCRIDQDYSYKLSPLSIWVSQHEPCREYLHRLFELSRISTVTTWTSTFELLNRFNKCTKKIPSKGEAFVYSVRVIPLNQVRPTQCMPKVV